MVVKSQYDVFLSHNNADKQTVELIARRLREQAHLNPFLDKWNLIPGVPWEEALEQALDQSATVAVFLGPSGISPWHNEEMRVALTKAVRARGDYRVIPVLLPGAKESAVTSFLANRTWVDFRKGTDDADAFARLVAGILGKPPEQAGAFTLPDEPAPYPGLLPFSGKQSEFFFGRTEEQTQLLARVRESHFVAVVGASGSGKSSLVLAGLLPALDKHWRAIKLVPGTRPLRALADQLATLVSLENRLRVADDLEARLAAHSDGLTTAASTLLVDRSEITTLLIVIDQFEELFTQIAGTQDEVRRQQRQFIANLVEAVQVPQERIRVVITLRADFVQHCLGFADLRVLLEPNQLLLGPMSDNALREAIVKPAQAVGALLEKGVVGRLIDDMRDQPAALPLMQFALAQLWQRRQGVWLTHTAYEEIGGVAGALDKRADAIYARWNKSQKNLARNLFVRLVALGEGASDTRRRVHRDELNLVGATHEEMDNLIAALAQPNVRLIAVDADTVELAHEALIEQWQQLRRWLEQDRDDLRAHRGLTEAAADWQKSNRNESYLYHGARLARAEEWAKKHGSVMSVQERAFLDASLTLRAREQAARERSRRLVTLAAIGAALIFLCLALGASGLALWANVQSNLATRAQQTTVAESKVRATAQAMAEQQRQIALSRQLAAQSIEEWNRDPSLALLQSVAAMQPANTFEARNALLSGLTLSPRLAGFLHGHSSEVKSVAFSPDGRTLATGSCGNLILGMYASVCTEGEIRLWDLSSRKQVAVLKGYPSEGSISFVFNLAFSPDGKLLASSGDGSTVFWDMATKSRSGQTISGEGAVFTPDGKVLATEGSDGITLWDLSSQKTVLQPFKGHGVSFSSDGRMLAYISSDNNINIVEMVDGKFIGQLGGQTGNLRYIAFSPDGKTLAGAYDSSIVFWDVESRKLLGNPLTEHTSDISSIAFTPDGKTLASASRDKTIILWDVKTAQQIGQPLLGHTGTINAIAFSPDGTLLASVASPSVSLSQDNCVILWDMKNASGVGRLLTSNASRVGNLIFNPDGRTLAASNDKGILLFDIVNGKPITQFSGGPAMVFSRNGHFLATVDASNRIILRDASTGQASGQPLVGHQATITSMAFSPDDKILVSGSCGKFDSKKACVQGEIYFWDVATRQPLGSPLAGHTDSVSNLAFDLDGKTLASTDNDTVILWEVATRNKKNEIEVVGERNFKLHVAFSPNLPFFATVGSVDRAISVQNTQNGQIVGHLFVADHLMWSVAFSPDGNTLATGTMNEEHPNASNYVLLWDVQTGRPMGRHLTVNSFALSVAFSSDGQTLASGDNLGNIILWDLDIKNWINRACRIANRNMTKEEWQQFVGGDYQRTCPTLP